MKGVVKIFRRVSKYLDGEGIFIFDFNTVHKQARGKDIKGDVVYQDHIKGSFWKIDIETSSGREQHRERLYTLEEMKSALDESGMHIENVYSDFETEVSKENGHERLIVVARKDQE